VVSFKKLYLTRVLHDLQIEYTIVRIDHEKKVARLALVGPETLDKINEEEQRTPEE